MDLMRLVSGRLIHPLVVDRPGCSVGRSHRELERSQWYDAVQLEELQRTQWTQTLVHAWDTIPYYRESFAAAGLDRSALVNGVEPSDVPTLVKSDLQENVEILRSRAVEDADIRWNRTGGSTGQPVRFCYDRRRAHDRRALTFRHDGWAGWEPGARIAQLWGSARDNSAMQTAKMRFRRIVFDRRLSFDVSSVDEAGLTRFHTELLRWRPHVIVGYANAVYLFARFLEDTGRRGLPGLRGIVTSAELLERDRRTTIEAALGAPVFDRYGARETSVIASECEVHDGMHVAAESLLVEIDSPNPVQPGPVIVTDLKNRAMPLIRYRIGDVARAVPGACACGRGLPRIAVEGGRVTEFLVRADDSLVSGAALTINLLARFDQVGRGRFLQDRRRDLRMEIVPAEGWSDQVKAELTGAIREAMGEGLSIVVDEVESIPLAASGKHRFSQSEAISEDLTVLPRG